MKLAINSDDIESKVIDLDIQSTIDCIDPNLYSKIEQFPINTIRLKLLQGTWNQSILPVSNECSDDSKNLTVKGYNVLMSDVMKTYCWSNATNIEIFALNKVFIDVDIEKFSAYLSIIAPVWEVRESWVTILGNVRTIDLSGANGCNHKNSVFSGWTTRNICSGSTGNKKQNFLIFITTYPESIIDFHTF